MRSLIFIVLFILVVSICQAEDWSSCADDLDRLRRAARDAADAAEQAESARQEFESKKEELENCLSYPDIYDLMQDNCQSIRWDYESTRDDYESALSTLESELDTVLRRFRSLEWSCGVQYTPRTSIKPKVSQKNRTCKMLQSYKGKMPIKSLLGLCKKYMSEKECRECLQSK